MDAQDIIQRLYDLGVSYSAIAALIGCRRETISRVASGLESGRNIEWRLQRLWQAVAR